MSDHNTDAVFSPWAKPVGMIPTFARYQAINGLKPKSPHISLDNSLLKNITCEWPTCDGTGLHGTYGGLAVLWLLVKVIWRNLNDYASR